MRSRQERAEGFVLQALVTGCVVGIVLGGMRKTALVSLLAALLQVYEVEYGFLLTRFVGILSAAVLIGAIAGLLRVGGSFDKPAVPGAVIGTLTSFAFVLPAPLNAALNVEVSNWGMVVGGIIVLTSFVLTYHLPDLLAGAGSGAIIGAVYNHRVANGADSAPVALGVILGTVAAVTASSLSFHYVILGLESSASSFSIALFVFRTLLGLVAGSVIGLLVIVVRQRSAPLRRSDADKISRD